MRNAEGNRNDCFAYTQADNDKGGGRSALDASGGADYGFFGDGTPNCDGSPYVTRLQRGSGADPRSTPVPTPVAGAPDADRDSVVAGRLRRHDWKVYPGV